MIKVKNNRPNYHLFPLVIVYSREKVQSNMQNVEYVIYPITHFLFSFVRSEILLD